MSNENKDRGFTNGEVMSMFESLQSGIGVVAEGVTALRADVDILKKDVSEIKTRLTSVEDVIKIIIPAHDKRITRLELKAAG